MPAFIPALIILLLLPAQADSPTTRPTIDVDSGSHASRRADLLQAIPADACLAVIADLHGDSLLENMLKAMAQVRSAGTDHAEMDAELLNSIPGEIAFGVVPDPRTPDDADVVVVMDVSRPGFDFRDWLDRRLLPVLRKQGRRNRLASLRVEGDGGSLRIVNPRDDKKTLVYISVRGGTAVMANRPDLAREAATIRDADKSFVDAPGIRKILRELPNDAPIKMLFNPAPLLKAKKPPRKRSTEELLLQVLHPEDLVAAGGFIQWRNRSIELGVSAQLADECKGIAQWFDRPDSESVLMRELAGDFPVLTRVGLTSLTSVPDALYKITDNFDETIGIEYREDLAEFNRQTGIDLNAAILGQIQSEFIFAARPDFSRQPPVAWTAVAGIQNAETLENACAKLVEHFEVAVDSRTMDGMTIHSAPPPVELAWGIVGNRLVIGDCPTTIRDVARRLKSGPTGKSTDTVERGMRELGAANQMMLLVDVALLGQQAPMLPALAGPKLGPLLGGGYVGASVTHRDRTVQLRMRWELGGGMKGNNDASDTGADQLMANLTENLLDAMSAARRNGQSVIGLANQRNIAQALYVYAQSHENHFPESIEALVAENPDILPLALLANPYTEEGPESPDEIAEYSHVIYRPGLSPDSGPAEVILAEKTVQNRGSASGANFTFVDAHCEFVEDPVASRLIEMIEAGEQEVTLEAARASLDPANAP